MLFDLCCCHGWCAYLEVLMCLQFVSEKLAGQNATLSTKVVWMPNATMQDNVACVAIYVMRYYNQH